MKSVWSLEVAISKMMVFEEGEVSKVLIKERGGVLQFNDENVMKAVSMARFISSFVIFETPSFNVLLLLKKIKMRQEESV